MAYPPHPPLRRLRWRGRLREFTHAPPRCGAWRWHSGLTASFAKSQFQPTQSWRSSKQASTTPTRSERDGDANPVGQGGGRGRSGRPGGHGGIRIPVALAQHQQLDGFASPLCSLSAYSLTHRKNVEYACLACVAESASRSASASRALKNKHARYPFNPPCVNPLTTRS
jgi:hypothetical protein